MTQVNMLQSATHTAAHVCITGCILKVRGIGGKNLCDIKLDRKQKRHGAGGGGCEEIVRMGAGMMRRAARCACEEKLIKRRE
jgi:hypothetical protein